ncbi:MAG: hypothetical protein K8F54_11570 [Altibacter sp.]|uniref:hypothetical protein n=1 Tax=Altibacter sp. TaxID=2024823 RepID=UPI001D38914D|nr:hypothetical protein [Altibacter sp.]MBZ0328238.1 hypothetical protein [Altibacter sp.]
MNYKLLLIALLAATLSQAQSFTGSFDLIITQVYNNGNQRIDSISYYFNETKTAIIIHAEQNQPDLRLVFSPADTTITGLFEIKDTKGGYILPMNEKNWPAMHYALREYGTGPRTKLNYTGEQKEINGLWCSEINCESEEFEISVWGTNTIELTLIQLLAYQTVGAGEDTKAIDMLDKCGIQSFAIETILRGKNDKPDLSLKVENLSKEVDTTIFSAKGHILSDMRK